MAEFQLLSCSIMLAGSRDSVVYRDAFNPLSYPEILIVQFLHGDDAVNEIEEVGTLTMSNADLLHHLRMTYPQEAVQQCFPGARPNLQTRSDEFPKSRALLMEQQDARDAEDADKAKKPEMPIPTPGPGPSRENMKVAEPQPKPPAHRPAPTHHATQRSSYAAGGTADTAGGVVADKKDDKGKDDKDAGPFA
jgi:hypothetical protein